ncbi:Calcium-transporting ATPase 12, plasma membrane-type [Camellia lanceoleosa]|uniref:Calcium-transporting ATPase 12, plasma membrane-type n=1 Tax=Camellia lanceoleosa TaxID=1840588 RepID=A0ACC0HHK4_9ERIC|nr:Calcium-transporting ATPase 12, plasma membrane-type [Camellia lanceoleosa]
MDNCFRARFNGRKLGPISSSKAQKRWHLAYTIVYCTRAWLSLGLCKANINQKFFLRMPSYVMVDVEPDNFHSIDQCLSKLVRKRNSKWLARLGGVEGLVAKLQTNAENGIKGDVDDIASRRNIYGSNSYRKPPAKTFHVVMDAIAEAFKDPIILILLVCAALSLGFGVHKDGFKGCSDGASTFVAVFLVIAVSASINYRLKKQFNKLSQGSSDIWVDVTRNGQQQQIPIFDVVVGDVVSLKIGDQVPADGLFLDGHSLKVDESSMTAKSYPLEEVDHIFNPFLLSGTKVIDGDARMLVTSVGMNTEWGQIMSKINYDFDEKTPLQAKLKNLALFIGMVGMLAAFLVLVILLIHYFTGNMHGDNGSWEFTGGKKNIHYLFKAVVGILATPVAIAATAFPEGFLFAVKVTFADSTQRMLANQALVRNLSASEAMGSITAICTDKRGTLTMNQMKVTMFWVGPKYIGDSASSSISPSVRELLCQGVGLNETQYPSGSPSELTEKAIHEWGVKRICMNIEELRKSCDILHVEALNFEKKRSVLIRKKADQTIHMHHKGSPEVLLAVCSHYYDATGNILVISNRAREKLWQVIHRMLTNGFQCIAFVHKQLSQVSQEDYFHQNARRGLFELIRACGPKGPMST